MKKLLFFLLVSSSISVFASDPSEDEKANTISYHLTGKVLEFTTGEALTGVEITILGSGKKVYTGFNGEFQISGLNVNDHYTIQISYISYKKKIIRGVKLDNGELIIKLKSENSPSRQVENEKNPKA